MEPLAGDSQKDGADKGTPLIDGRYQMGDIIGRGGMGDVREGKDVRLGRPVAIKLLRSDLAEQGDLRQRFEDEALSAARISHPNVVAIYDTGEHEGVPFIVMERLPGRTLADEIGEGALDQTRACFVICHVLAALEAAHAAGVIHRDIKPSNVLLTAAGEAKVADFGIAKVIESADRTTTGTLVGTPSYLAPERVAGRPATVVSDVYSVGVLLYEALTATKPFDADTPLAMLHAITQVEPTPLSELRPDVSVEIAEVAKRAMAKDPQSRYPSAENMLNALRGGSVPGPPPAEATVVTDAEATTSMGNPRTQVLTAPNPAPAQAVRAGPGMAPRTLKVIAGIGAGLLVLIFVVLSLSGKSGPNASPTSLAPTPTVSTVPGPLARALDDLDRAIRP